MHLVRDLLDKQLVDRGGNRIGQVDGLVIDLLPGEQPRVKAIETGLGVVLDRLGWRTKNRRHRISIKEIRDVDIAVALDVDSDEMPVTKWQNWLRHRVLRWIPGGLS